MAAQAYALQNNALASGAIEDFLPFFDDKKHVISLVGGGGKTTTLYYLAACFACRGQRTCVITTTRMGRPALYCTDISQCRAQWVQGMYAVCGQIAEGGKFRAPDSDTLRVLLDEADVLLIEADGSHRLPCKAPAEHEPALLPETDTVVGVMGLDAAGGRVRDVCLRTDKVCALLQCDENHALTEADMARILLSPDGTRKGVEGRRFVVILNKCDDEMRKQHGENILRILAAQGQQHALLTCHRDHRSEQYEYPKG